MDGDVDIIIEEDNVSSIGEEVEKDIARRKELRTGCVCLG